MSSSIRPQSSGGLPTTLIFSNPRNRLQFGRKGSRREEGATKEMKRVKRLMIKGSRVEMKHYQKKLLEREMYHYVYRLGTNQDLVFQHQAHLGPDPSPHLVLCAIVGTDQQNEWYLEDGVASSFG